MPEQQQEPLDGMQATRVKFVGMAADSLEQLPEINDRIVFTVETVCTGRGMELMKDGELRRTARMEVLTLSPNGPPIKPNGTPSLFSVADDTDDGSWDGDSE